MSEHLVLDTTARGRPRSAPQSARALSGRAQYLHKLASSRAISSSSHDEAANPQQPDAVKQSLIVGRMRPTSANMPSRTQPTVTKLLSPKPPYVMHTPSSKSTFVETSSERDVAAKEAAEAALAAYPPVVKEACLLYTSPSPRDGLLSRMPSSA